MIQAIFVVFGIYIGICVFYIVFQERLLFVSLRKKNADAKIVLGSDFEELFLDAPMGGSIHILRIKCSKPRGCIIYFHGNTGGVGRWGAIAEELTSYGFEIFLPDYRGYGKSRGKRTEEILHQDAELVYNEVLKFYPESQICLYGRSLGSGIATKLAASTKPKAVVLETPFLNMIDVAAYHARIIPIKFFLKFEFRSDLYVNDIEAPILLAHGTKDKIVPHKSAMALYSCIKDKSKVKMLTIPGGNHGDLNGYPVMRRSLETFFNRHFGMLK